MKKKWRTLMATISYMLGVVASIYVGGWIMLVKPVRILMYMVQTGPMDLHMLVKCIVQIAFSTTVAGLVWCIGYIFCNYFKGTEDEYDRLMADIQKKKELAKKKARDNMSQVGITHDTMTQENIEKRTVK